MMHMDKYISLLTHLRTFRLPMDSKLQEEVSIWYQISSLCGPHSLHVSPCSIYSCIYLISYIIEYLSHSNVPTSFISSLFKISNVSIQPWNQQGDGIVLLCNYLNGYITVLPTQYCLYSSNFRFVCCNTLITFIFSSDE